MAAVEQTRPAASCRFYRQLVANVNQSINQSINKYINNNFEVVNNHFEGAHPHAGSSSAIHGQTGIWKLWLFMRAENRSTQRKISRSKGENKQQTQPLMASTPGFEPGPHLVRSRGEGSHHCVTLAPRLKSVRCTF